MEFFKGYLKIGDNHYREDFGLFFEDFKVGQKFKHRPGVTLSQQDNKNEALGTINNAQLHYDNNYANHTEWKKCLGDSTLTLQLIIGMTWKTFGKKERILRYEDIVMPHPYFGGDTLYAESEILDVIDCDNEVGILKVRTNGINQHQITICKINYEILIYKKGHYPLHPTISREAYNLTNQKFASHRKLQDGTFIEETGIYFEDLDVDEIYEHFPAITLTTEEVRRHALSSLDWNPRYTDIRVAQRLFDNQYPVPEGFLVGVITALTTRTFGRVVANLEWKNVELPEIAFAEDTIRAESTIVSKRESKSRPSQGIIQVSTNAFNQKDKMVCHFERYLLVYRKGLGPYEDAGY